MENRDIRLYTYDSSVLHREGTGSTGTRPHKFKDYQKCIEYIDYLKINFKGFRNRQFVIIEYFGAFHSKIIQIIDN